jgi:MFS family permease
VTSLTNLYHEFPRRFWVVVGVHFVDKIGGTLVFPFFALYITGKFHVGMTEAGILLGLLSLAGIVGSVIGGALTDRLGRRKLILFGLLASAFSALTFGSVSRFAWLFPVAAFVGLFSEVGGPAHAAMIADILPKEQRQEGFGILRVVGNMAWLVGPTMVNQFRLTYVRNFGGRLNLPDISLGDLGSTFNIQGPKSLPAINVSGFMNFSNSIQGPVAGSNYYGIRESLNITRGRHSLKMGVDGSLEKLLARLRCLGASRSGPAAR